MVKKIKKIKLLCVLCSFACIMPSTSCKNSFTYESKEKGISFTLEEKSDISENENSISFSIGEKIEIVLSVADVSEAVPEEYKNLLREEELDLECGAYNNNYYNYAYVSELFNYLFESSSQNYLISGISKTTFGSNSYQAFSAQIISENDDVNGYVYETVQDMRLYILCIYIKDSLKNIYDYSEEIESFTKTITFKQTEEIK